MANIFDKTIQDAREANGGKDDELVKALLAKKEEMGEDVSEEDAIEAIKAIILSSIFEGDEERSPIVLSDEDREYMEKATSTVKEFLDSNKLKYSEQAFRPDLVMYEIVGNVRGFNLIIRIHVETNPKVCCIDAKLPIAADPLYEYPLCAWLAKENYHKRFGSMKYDSRSGDLLYTYSILTKRGIFLDDLDILFHTVISSAIDGYDAIKKLAVGRFKKKEKDEIIQKVNDLVEDIYGE